MHFIVCYNVYGLLHSKSTYCIVVILYYSECRLIAWFGISSLDSLRIYSAVFIVLMYFTHCTIICIISWMFYLVCIIWFLQMPAEFKATNHFHSYKYGIVICEEETMLYNGFLMKMKTWTLKKKTVLEYFKHIFIFIQFFFFLLLK